MLVIAVNAVGLVYMPCAAWVFGSGSMLLWAMAALLPIVIHLWSRRKYQEVSWAAMEYLLAAVQKYARRIRIEQWVLLALRVIIVLLFALALADPRVSWWPSSSAGGASGKRIHRVIVIDGSFSMAAQDREGSRFLLAKQAAAEWVRAASQGDAFSLVLMTDPPEVIIQNPAFDAEDVLRELNALVLPHGMADLGSTLNVVEQLLTRAQGDQSARFQETVVRFFTDMGEVTWQDVTTPPLADRLESLATRVRCQLVDVATDLAQNLAVTRCEIQSDWITVFQEVPWVAEVKNFSGRAVTGLPVEFWVDGQRVHQVRVDVAPSSQVTVDHRVRFQSPGEHQLEVRIREDALSLDNQRWASVPVRESLQVLCVEGRPGAADYVALSLNPDRGRQPRIRPEVISEIGLLEQDLARYAAVFFCNVSRFGPEEANILFEYVRQSGTVVFFLGDQVQSEDYNAYLGAGRGEKRVLPARLLEPVVPGNYRFNPGDYKHPIIAPFRGQVGTGLLTAPISRYIRVAPYADLEQGESMVALRFTNGDPAIIEERIGRGRSILFVTAASDQSLVRGLEPAVPWSDLGTWPSFLPLVQESLALGVRSQEQKRNVQVGQPLELSRARMPDVLRVNVVNPQGQSDPLPGRSDPGASAWWYEQTRFSGMYEARVGSPAESSEWFAVNVDTRESDLSRMDTDLLPSQVELGAAELEREDHVPSRVAGYAIYRYLLTGLLLLLLTESFYAYYLGRTRG